MASDAENISAAKPFSWLDPHPIFVIILVGPDETPYGIQKDFLCAKSAYYRSYFSEKTEDSIEYIVKLPNTSPQVFGLVQSYLYTGTLISGDTLPGYDVLIAAWKVGQELGIEQLCDEVLDTMVECRRLTQHIPATPLLVQVWRDTPEGSSIRQLLLSWAAEYIRSSESRSEFSKSLPQEVLSELVVAMTHLNSSTLVKIGSATPPGDQPQKKNVHYLDAEDGNGEHDGRGFKHRYPEVLVARNPLQADRKVSKKASRVSLPGSKPAKARRISGTNGGANSVVFSTEQKLSFCSDLLTRMLSGPGYWTRIVGPFRDPVKPVEDGVPDYSEKVTKPMDLGTIKDKMDQKQYTSDEEFVADVRQIFTNCYLYWTQNDPMWAAGQKFEKTFEEKYATMNKWLSKMDGDDAT